VVVAVAACGDNLSGVADDGEPDAGVDATDVFRDAAPFGHCANPVTPVAPAHVHAAGGAGNGGQACQNGGCHAAGGGGSTFSFSGTVYTDANATTPRQGATIKVAFGSTTLTVVSDAEGNFYGTQAIAFPAKTLGTSCPTVAPMVGYVVAGGGNCNSCHTKSSGAPTVPIFVQ
jgi:hypothetical protein